jgi:F0F1-type ATP synthase membrane subunit b/b'
MIQLDGTVLIVFLSFFVYMFLMKAIYFDPIMRIKHEREDSIDKGYQMATDADKKTVEIEETYQKSMVEARRKAQAVMQKYREEARAKASAQLHEARQQALTEIDQRVSELRQSQDSVYHQLEGQKDELAAMIAKKLSGSAQATASSAVL